MRLLIWIRCTSGITVDPVRLCWCPLCVMLRLSFFHIDLSFFETSLEMFSSEQKEVQAIQESTQVGLLLVDKKGFKEKFESSLHSRLEVMTFCAQTF